MTLNNPPIPVCHTIEVDPGSQFGDGLAIDFTNYASFCQITNFGPTAVNVMLNGASNAIFTLDSGTQTFDKNELLITSLDFDQPQMSVAPVMVQVIAGVIKG